MSNLKKQFEISYAELFQTRNTTGSAPPKLNPIRRGDLYLADIGIQRASIIERNVKYLIEHGRERSI